MSGTVENRWRRGQPLSQQTQSQRGQQAPSATPNGPGQIRTNVPNGNNRPVSATWAQDRRPNSNGASLGTQSPKAGPGSVSAGPVTGPSGFGKDKPSGAVEKGEKSGGASKFDAEEVTAYLKNEFHTIVSQAGTEKNLVYQSTRPESKTPWATRTTQMASGRDFFLELSKQIKALGEARKK